MRISLIVAQALAATALAAPTVFRRTPQEIEAEGGDAFSNGSAAISSPNINNGEQVDSSLITGKSGAGDIINNPVGNSVTNVNTNSANKGNIVINPSVVTSNGNNGLNANGDENALGASQDIGPVQLRKRMF
ncbi:hypothetical protein H4R20_003060 [Coemansia guatemalensis]|uniref:Uncharacterized protein n=1 Tax=Coemansia guatemalensis TaxID=2761395 RepID=A0A9W8HYU3_9FUNG|nr:hypothetical protein H4R20_003060 [Coemansia guatemalensis]